MTTKSATLFKKDCNTGVFLSILRNFEEHLRTTASDDYELVILQSKFNIKKHKKKHLLKYLVV